GAASSTPRPSPPATSSRSLTAPSPRSAAPSLSPSAPWSATSRPTSRRPTVPRLFSREKAPPRTFFAPPPVTSASFLRFSLCVWSSIVARPTPKIEFLTAQEICHAFAFLYPCPPHRSASPGSHFRNRRRHVRLRRRIWRWIPPVPRR